MTAEIATSPELATFVMLATIALGLPVPLSCATAPLKLLTSEQYAGVLPLAAVVVLAAAVVLVAAGVVLLLLAAVVLLPLPHPARNPAAATARTIIAARRQA